jgi:hypothetical protein
MPCQSARWGPGAAYLYALFDVREATNETRDMPAHVAPTITSAMPQGGAMRLLINAEKSASSTRAAAMDRRDMRRGS